MTITENGSRWMACIAAIAALTLSACGAESTDTSSVAAAPTAATTDIQVDPPVAISTTPAVIREYMELATGLEHSKAINRDANHGTTCAKGYVARELTLGGDAQLNDTVITTSVARGEATITVDGSLASARAVIINRSFDATIPTFIREADASTLHWSGRSEEVTSLTLCTTTNAEVTFVSFPNLSGYLS